MGRQGFLRLAYGLSAFEPPDGVSPSGDWRAPGESATPMQRGIITDYEQTYDQKGHPVNARSREYGKAKRAAHNDALAAIGAIKRKSQEQAAEARIHKQTEQSDIPWALRSPQTLASAFGGLFVQSVIMTVGQWPLQMMDRLFVSDFPENMTLAEVMVSQYRALGPWGVFLPGFGSTITYALYRAAIDWLQFATIMDRLVLASIKSRTIRDAQPHLMEHLNRVASGISGLIIDIFTVHYTLQGLGLVAPNVYIPPLRAVNPVPVFRAVFGFAEGQNLTAVLTSVISSPLSLSWLHRNIVNRLTHLLLYRIMASCFMIQGNKAQSIRLQPGFLKQFSSFVAVPIITLYKAFGWTLSYGHDSRQAAEVQTYRTHPSITAGGIASLGNSAREPDVDTIEESIEVEIAIEGEEVATPDHVRDGTRDNRDSHVLRVGARQHPQFLNSKPLTEKGVYDLVSFNVRIARLASLMLLRPLGYLVARRITSTFMENGSYVWAPNGGFILPRPRGGKEWLVLAGRVCFYLGLQLATDMSSWIIETTFRHRRSLRAQKNLKASAVRTEHFPAEADLSQQEVGRLRPLARSMNEPSADVDSVVD